IRIAIAIIPRPADVASHWGSRTRSHVDLLKQGCRSVVFKKSLSQEVAFIRLRRGGTGAASCAFRVASATGWTLRLAFRRAAVPLQIRPADLPSRCIKHTYAFCIVELHACDGSGPERKPLAVKLERR